MTKPDTETDAVLDDGWQGGESPEESRGEHGLRKGLTKRLVERARAAALTTHLESVPHVRHPAQHGNVRKGTRVKTVETERGPMELAVPRDRAGPVEPTGGGTKRQRRLDGFDDQVLALDAPGRSTREIQHHLEEVYGTEGSLTLIATITAAVVEAVRRWQSRPVETGSPSLDVACLFVQSRHEGTGKTNAVSVALGVTLTGEKEWFGLWRSEPAGAKGWLASFTALTQRGGTDCFVACVDGRTGGPTRWRRSFHAPRCHAAWCRQSDTPCGMWWGGSAVPGPGIGARLRARRRSRKPKPPWSAGP